MLPMFLLLSSTCRPSSTAAFVHSVLAMAENRADEAVANIRKGMEIGQASNLMRPYYLGLLAEALGAAGDKEGALGAIFNALSMAETSGERWWEAELCRLRGELLRSCLRTKGQRSMVSAVAGC